MIDQKAIDESQRSISKGKSSNFSNDNNEEKQRSFLLELRKSFTNLGDTNSDTTTISLSGDELDDPSIINFNRIKFQGRIKELGQLKEILQESGTNSKCVMVHGMAGSGKTSLVKEFMNNLTSTSTSILCYGKFEELKENKISTIVDCFQSILSQIVELEENWFEQLSEEGKFNIQQLIQIFPQFGMVFQDTTVLSKDKSKNTTGMNQVGSAQIFVFLRNVLRCVCDFYHVVFVLDDLHNLDQDLTKHLDCIVGDTEAKNILVVGTQRSSMSEKEVPKIWKEATSIHLENFLDVDIAAFLENLLGINNTADLTAISKVMHRKTGGNIHLLIEFVRLLARQNLLKFSYQTMKFEWDLDKIIEQTDVSDNVLELISVRLQDLDADTLSILQFAGFLGATTFDAHLLSEFFQDYEVQCSLSISEPISGVPFVVNYKLGQAVEEGILEKLEHKNCYKFSHGKLWQSATTKRKFNFFEELIPQDDRKQQVHYHVGRVLRNLCISEKKCSTNLSVDQLLQLATRHSNQAFRFLETEAEVLQVIALNERLSQIERRMGMFSSACTHLQKATMLLEMRIPEAWSDERYYPTILQLKSEMANLMFLNGNVEGLNVIASEILTEARCVLDKCPIFHVLINSKVEGGDIEQAIALCSTVLAELNHHIPKHSIRFQSAKALLKLKRKLKTLEDDYWLTLRMNNDSKGEMVQKQEFLNLFLQLCVRSGLYHYRTLGTLQFGLVTLESSEGNNWTAPALATLALVQANTGNLKEAFRYSRLMHRIIDKNPEYTGENSRALGINYCYIAHQQESYHACLDGLLRSYKLSLESGEMTTMILVMIGYSACYYLAGLNLIPLQVDQSNFVLLLEDLGQKQSSLSFRSFLQFTLNLTGQDNSNNPLEFLGQAFTAEHLEELKAQESNRPLDYYQMNHMMLSYLMNDFDKANEISCNLCPEKREGTIVWLAPRLFYQGLIAYALGKKRTGLAFQRKIESFVRENNRNCHHMYLLLKAEYAALTWKDASSVRNAYDESIRAAQRLGFTHHAAIGNERAGAYMLRQTTTKQISPFAKHSMKIWAETYFKRAFELYANWGARTKCLQMIQKYEGVEFERSLMASSTQWSAKGTIRARPRFTETREGTWTLKRV